MSELKHPYYIFSPDYRESSGGIQALHKLCHRINLRGGSAWMVDCTVCNPKWNTPLLDAETYQQHKNSQLVPIAVYPEIYSGNPLNADVCVRYMLNHEALLNGNRLNESEEDLFFWYSSQLIVKEPQVDFLTMVGPDLEMFSDDGRTKKDKLLYLNRVPESAVNFAALPAELKVISVQKPRPLAELAEILKSAAVMYTFEWSGTCNLAALCGVPVVSLIAPGYEKLAISDASIRDMGGAGVCLSDDERALQQTRREIYKVREHMQQFEANFAAQLTHFFDKTQQAARQKSSETFIPLEKWLQDYPTAEALLPETAHSLSLTIVVLDSGQKGDLDNTLSSLAALKAEVCIYPLSVPAGAERGADHFNGWLAETLTHPSDWILFIHAGDILYPQHFSTLLLFREHIRHALAFYSDRIIEHADEKPEAQFLSGFDPDSFIATPERFARGAFFRRELCEEIIRQREVSPLTVEIDFLFQLVNASLESDIQHIPLPLLALKKSEAYCAPVKRALLTEHLGLKGYHHATVEEEGNGVYAISYQGNAVEKITVVMIIEDNVDGIKRTLATFVDSVKTIDYEIILIDNFTNNPAIKTWLTSLAEINQAVFRVYFTDEKISAVSALNFAFSVARGDFTLYLAYGVHFENNGWLEALLNHCGRPEVMACAPRLMDAHNHQRSSGMINGQHTVADATDPQSWDVCVAESGEARRFLLLSAECIMVRTASCQEAGGLNEQLPAIQLAMNDLLLRTADASHIHLSVPRSRVHVEKTLPENADVSAWFNEQWLPVLARDPGYNLNLSFTRNGLRREDDHALLAARLGFKLNALFITDRARGAEKARYNDLSQLIKQQGRQSTLLYRPLTLCDGYLMQPEQIIFSDVVALRHIELLKNKALLSACRIVIEVTSASLCRSADQNQAISGYADVLLVRNADARKLLNHQKVCLQPDKLTSDWSGLVLPERPIAETQPKLRAGIVLAGLQPDDWKLVDMLIKEMSGELEWIIYGACPDAWKPYIHEYHRKVPANRLKQTLQSLKLDLVLAPLASSPANLAEGHSVIIQAGACGYPVLASDHAAYQAVRSATLIKNKTSQWRYMIKKVMDDATYRCRLAETLYQEVNTCWIYHEDELPSWLALSAEECLQGAAG